MFADFALALLAEVGVELKVDPRADASPPFRQLIEQVCFDHWLDRQRGQS